MPVSTRNHMKRAMNITKGNEDASKNNFYEKGSKLGLHTNKFTFIL